MASVVIVALQNLKKKSGGLCPDPNVDPALLSLPYKEVISDSAPATSCNRIRGVDRRQRIPVPSPYMHQHSLSSVGARTYITL
jgi:hypothetical protein